MPNFHYLMINCKERDNKIVQRHAFVLVDYICTCLTYDLNLY